MKRTLWIWLKREQYVTYRFCQTALFRLPRQEDEHMILWNTFLWLAETNLISSVRATPTYRSVPFVSNHSYDSDLPRYLLSSQRLSNRMLHMALNALIVAFIFAFTVSGVRGCDPKKCCCPNGTLTATQADTQVTIKYTRVTGSKCTGQKPGLITTTCRVSKNMCSTTSGYFNYTATKTGRRVSVNDRNDDRCNMDLQCASTSTSTNCSNTATWAGSYTVVSGSEGVVVSVTCLLIATLSGILI